MRWSPNPLVIDPAMVFLIAQDLQRVAEADGVLHERELRLIEAFSSAAEHTGERQLQPTTPQQQELYTRSLVMLALADGELCAEEYGLVHSLASSRGISEELVERVIQDILFRFYGSAVQARTLREQLRTAARELGFEADEAAGLWPDRAS